MKQSKLLNNLGYVFILVLLVLGGVLGWQSFFKTYTQEDTVSIHSFPREIGEWSSEEMTIPEGDYAILETRNAFVRRYFTDAGREVDLFIIYSEHNRKVSHPPELCYRGSGAVILSKKNETIPLDSSFKEPVLKVKKMALELGPTQQLLFYWFKVGDTFVADYYQQQLKIAIKNFFRQPASSALIRISTIVKNDDPDQAARDLKDFSRLILPYLSQYLP